MPPRSQSPFAEGFAALWCDPALLAAELTWRWCFGFSALVLAILSAGVFLDSLTVSPADRLLLSTLQPVLLNRAVHHIFGGRLLQLLWIQAILVLGLTLAWALAATAGRAATLRRLVAMFGEEEEEAEELTWRFRAVFALNLMRAAWSLAALGAVVASFSLGISFVHQERAATAAFFFVFGVALACVFGFVLNWFLGLAPLFCISEQLGAREAIGRTVDFCLDRTPRVLGVSVGFLLLRIVWAATMLLFFLWPLHLSEKIVPGWVMLMMVSVALVYFAGADLLYLARLGAYAALAEQGDDYVATEVPGPSVIPPVEPGSPALPAHLEPA